MASGECIISFAPEQLGELVALKTIRSEIADDQRALQRFKREITLARKVTHPNVSSARLRRD